MSTDQREWAAYVRVSKVGEREGESFHSPDTQAKAIARSHDKVWPTPFVDLDVSGGTFERDGLDAAIAWAREQPAKRGIAVYDIDRLGRDIVQSILLVRELRAEGIPVSVRGDEVETETSDGLLRWGIYMTIAESYRLKIGAQWRSVAERRLAAGRPRNGQPRFGYIRNPETGDFEPDPETAPWLRQAYLDYTNGAGFLAITEKFEREGVTSTRGMRIRVASLRGILDSGFGAGMLTKGATAREREYTQGIHEPVITKDEWEAYLRVRDGKKKLPSRSQSSKWFLSSIVRCGRCGARMGVDSFNPERGRSNAVCSAKKNEGGCGGFAVRRHIVERMVVNWVGAHIDELATNAHSQDRDEKRAAAQADRDAAQREVEQYERGIGNLTTMLALGKITESAYQSSLDEIHAALREARQNLASASERLDLLAPVDLDVYERLASSTEGMSTGEWNALLKKVLDKVVVTEKTATFYPVVGEPVTWDRPARAAWGSVSRGGRLVRT